MTFSWLSWPGQVMKVMKKSWTTFFVFGSSWLTRSSVQPRLNFFRDLILFFVTCFSRSWNWKLEVMKKSWKTFLWMCGCVSGHAVGWLADSGHTRARPRALLLWPADHRWLLYGHEEKPTPPPRLQPASLTHHSMFMSCHCAAVLLGITQDVGWAHL